MLALRVVIVFGLLLHHKSSGRSDSLGSSPQSRQHFAVKRSGRQVAHQLLDTPATPVSKVKTIDPSTCDCHQIHNDTVITLHVASSGPAFALTALIDSIWHIRSGQNIWLRQARNSQACGPQRNQGGGYGEASNCGSYCGDHVLSNPRPLGGVLMALSAVSSLGTAYKISKG